MTSFSHAFDVMFALIWLSLGFWFIVLTINSGIEMVRVIRKGSHGRNRNSRRR